MGEKIAIITLAIFAAIGIYYIVLAVVERAAGNAGKSGDGKKESGTNFLNSQRQLHAWQKNGRKTTKNGSGRERRADG